MKRTGPWSESDIRAFLEASRVPVRLACNGARGHPVLASLWFLPVGQELWCATQRPASIARHLHRDPRCAFEVAGDTAPYRGVRGQALARLDDARGETVLRDLIARYLPPDSPLAPKLLSRAATETAIALSPKRVVSWDYSERMGYRR